MALKNKVFIILFLIQTFANSFVLANDGTAKRNVPIAPLPELLAKQALNNIRFISFDGKYTYYQKRTGQLSLASNYKIFDVIKGDKLDHFTTIGSAYRKKLLISQNKNFHSFLSIRAKEIIYALDYGATEPKKVGEGITPKLHREDLWLSYYDAIAKEMHFLQTANDAIKFKIKINAKKNPYFVPQISFLDDDTVFYTDQNEDGVQAIFKYKRSTGKSDLIFKFNSPFLKIELCTNRNRLFLGQFGLKKMNSGSEIKEVTEESFTDLSKVKSIYSSELNDMGNMICSDEKALYFSQNQGTSNSDPIFEIASIDLGSRELKTHTYFKNVTQLTDMDGIFLITEKGKTFIVKGNNDFKYIDVLAAPSKAEP